MIRQDSSSGIWGQLRFLHDSLAQRPYPIQFEFSLRSPSRRIFRYDGTELHIEPKRLLREFLGLERLREVTHGVAYRLERIGKLPLQILLNACRLDGRVLV